MLQKLTNVTKIDHLVQGYPEFSDTSSPGYFCAKVIGRQVAQVLCRHLEQKFFYNLTNVNFTSADVYYGGSINCTGEEVDLTECEVSLQPTSQCPRDQIQQLTCTSCKYFSWKFVPLISLYILKREGGREGGREDGRMQEGGEEEKWKDDGRNKEF